jgi:hypothetical protein
MECDSWIDVQRFGSEVTHNGTEVLTVEGILPVNLAKICRGEKEYLISARLAHHTIHISLLAKGFREVATLSIVIGVPR